MSLNDIINLTITAQTKTPTRIGFGTPLLAAFHSVFPERVREYGSLAAMVSDGFAVDHPAYLMATAVWSQNPKPNKIKIGRRSTSYRQIMTLTPIDTAPGFVYLFEVDGIAVSYVVPAAATVATICTALTLLVNALVAKVTASDDTTHITSTTKIAGTSVTYETLLDPADFTMVDASTGTTMIQTVIVTPINVEAGYLYEFRVAGEDIEYEVQPGDVVADVVAGLEADINTKAGALVTATDETTHVEVTTDAPATLVDYAGFESPDDCTFEDTTPDPGIAADLAAFELADPTGWYGLLLDSQSKEQVVAAAGWIEARAKLFCYSTSDSECVDVGVTDDVMSVLKAATYACTAGIYSQTRLLNWSACAWVGGRFPYDPGKVTWSFKTLAGVTVDGALTEGQQSAILAKGGNVYVTVAGVNVTLYGKTASGEYIDITHFIDWFAQRLKERIFGILINNLKIPFTDSGIDCMRNAVLAQCQQGVQVGGLAASPAPTCTTPKAADIDPADKINRILPDVEFQATLAGAIHHLVLNGTLSV